MGLTGISLFSGAGGMDVGFAQAGIEVIWANDIDADACRTFAANHRAVIRCASIEKVVAEIGTIATPDIVFGGPPCQGFSVAGRMDLSDPRSALVFAFMAAVKRVMPRAFVMENVKALATLDKFRAVRERLFREADEMGYGHALVILQASDYGVPQNRERMFFVGFRNGVSGKDFASHIALAQCVAPSLREVVTPLGKAGSATNSRICNAKVTAAAKPVLRRSPYAGMMFNGQGRPLNPDGFASTLPATMGGNRTPIIDEPHLFDGQPAWIEDYHAHLRSGGKPLPLDGIPSRLRRLTIDEAMRIQTFPVDYTFIGKVSSVYAQIGNAVPCALAQQVGKSVRAVLEGFRSNTVVRNRTLFDRTAASRQALVYSTG